MLTANGFIRITPPSYGKEDSKFKIYYLEDRSVEKIKKAKAAILFERDKKGCTYRGDLDNFEEEIKQKRYLLKEGKTIQLLSGERSETPEKALEHRISVSQAILNKFNDKVTIGRDFNISGEHVIIQITVPSLPIEKENKKLNAKGVRRVIIIPGTDPGVVNREKPLDKIYKYFNTSNDRQKIFCITGDSARGKSELAKMYSLKYQKEYYHVWFVRAKGWESAYKSFAIDLQLFNNKSIKKEKLNEIVSKVHQSFENNNEKSLIIFDGIDDMGLQERFFECFPIGTDILVTAKKTRRRSQCLNLSLDSEFYLTEDEAHKILMYYVPNSSEQARKALIDRFGRLPAVLNKAGWYLQSCPTFPMEDYPQFFDQHKSDLLKPLSFEDMTRKAIDEDLEDVLISMKINLLLTKKEHVASFNFLYYFAFLPSKGIPRELLEKLAGNSLALNRLLHSLSNLIIQEVGHQQTLSIHDLYQEIMYEWIRNEKKEDEILEKLSEIAEDFEDYLSVNLNTTAMIYEKGISVYQKTNPSKSARYMLKLGLLYRKHGDYQQALDFCKQSYDVNKNLEALHYTGVLFFLLGEYKQSLDTHQQVLHKLDNIKDTSKIKRHQALNSMGIAYYKLGDLKEAIDKYSEAHFEAMQLKVTPLERAPMLTNMGHCLFAMGNIDKALENHQAALKIWDEFNHSLRTHALNGIGRCLSNQSPNEALKSFEASLEVHKRSFSPEHPEIARTLDGKADCLLYQNEIKGALELFEKALKIRQEKLSKNHPDTAYSLFGLAKCHSHLKDPSLAKEYFQEALKIREAKLGKDHHLTKELRSWH